MERITERPQIVVAGGSNSRTAVGLALSLVAGIGIAVLGHRLGGGELKRWLAFGVGVAVVGDILFLSSRRCCLPRGFKPKKEVQLPGDTDEVRRVGRYGGAKTILAPDIGRSTLSRNSGAQEWLDDTLKLDSEIGGETRPSYIASTATPIVEGVEQRIKGKTFSEINARIQVLNGVRLGLLAKLARQVKKPEDWDRPDVKATFEALHFTSCELAETTMRFLELKFPDSDEQRAAFLAQAYSGYIRVLIDVRRVYEFATTRSYFNQAKADQQKEPGLLAENYWNDVSCWEASNAVDQDKFFKKGTQERSWCKMFNRACNRIKPIAMVCSEARLGNVVTHHLSPGEWGEPPAPGTI